MTEMNETPISDKGRLTSHYFEHPIVLLQARTINRSS